MLCDFSMYAWSRVFPVSKTPRRTLESYDRQGPSCDVSPRNVLRVMISKFSCSIIEANFEWFTSKPIFNSSFHLIFHHLWRMVVWIKDRVCVEKDALKAKISPGHPFVVVRDVASDLATHKYVVKLHVHRSVKLCFRCGRCNLVYVVPENSGVR